jgi:hypothetical protein
MDPWLAQANTLLDRARIAAHDSGVDHLADAVRSTS